MLCSVADLDLRPSIQGSKAIGTRNERDRFRPWFRSSAEQARPLTLSVVGLVSFIPFAYGLL